MISCQNCGKTNSSGSNFCRFCGVKFLHMQRQTHPQVYKENFNPYARKPYSWKTDDFEIGQPQSARKTQEFSDERSFAEPSERETNRLHPQTAQQPQQNQRVQRYQPRPLTSHNYSCPRCASNMPPALTKKISTAGWIVFVALLLFFFPLFWIGFLIKEDVYVCPVCNLRIA